MNKQKLKERAAREAREAEEKEKRIAEKKAKMVADKKNGAKSKKAALEEAAEEK